MENTPLEIHFIFVDCFVSTLMRCSQNTIPLSVKAPRHRRLSNWADNEIVSSSSHHVGTSCQVRSLKYTLLDTATHLAHLGMYQMFTGPRRRRDSAGSIICNKPKLGPASWTDDNSTPGDISEEGYSSSPESSRDSTPCPVSPGRGPPGCQRDRGCNHW